MQSGLEVRHLTGCKDDPQIIGDAAGVDGLIDALVASSSGFRVAQVFSLARDLLPSGYPDHEVFVGVDPERSVGIIAFADGVVGNMVTDGQSSSRGSVAYHFIGEQRVFPGGSEVSIDSIRQALKEFLSSEGRIPTCVKWKSVDDWVEWPGD